MIVKKRLAAAAAGVAILGSGAVIPGTSAQGVKVNCANLKIDQIVLVLHLHTLEAQPQTQGVILTERVVQTQLTQLNFLSAAVGCGPLLPP